MHNRSSIRSATGIRKRVFLLLLAVFIPLLLLQAFTFYRWYQTRKATEMQANLELARAVGKNFETFLRGLVRSEEGVGLALAAFPDDDRSGSQSYPGQISGQHSRNPQRHVDESRRACRCRQLSSPHRL
jgi:hypothetical protein